MITVQDDLFVSADPFSRIHPAPFQASSKLSREAALISQGKISARNRQILRQAYDRDNANPRGITRKDVERVQGMATPTVCARLNALEQAKKLRKLYTIKAGAESQVTRERCAVYVLGPKFSDRDIP